VDSVVIAESVDARVGPRGSLEILSQAEIDKLLDTSHTGLYTLFRNCALAVLNSGSDNDNAKEILEHYRDFDVQIVRHAWGIKLAITNAPGAAFVDGQMIHGIKEHLFAVLRDIIYTANEIIGAGRLDSQDPASITNAVFHILRNARVLDVKTRPNLAVCWGGHAIGDAEYRYAKRVGYELGLRALDVCTGCGPGAMKAPMKGAGVGHAKQRITHGRFLGVTEPGIIAAEPPNAIVNQLVIMPDIEKRLEAFLRLAHGIVVFPGGVGTAEEIAKTQQRSDWRRLSAGAGTKGPRLHDWCYLELADLEGEESNHHSQVLWTRGLLIRRNIANGDLAYFTTWCPAGTSIKILVSVEGHRWAIEDSFETAKNEFGLDHNESRSWHGWHRHVSLVTAEGGPVERCSVNNSAKVVLVVDFPTTLIQHWPQQTCYT